MKAIEDLNKNSNEYMLRKLSQDQKDFIEDKIKEIGDLDRAKAFYTPEYGTKDLVTRYALYHIRALNNRKES